MGSLGFAHPESDTPKDSVVSSFRTKTIEVLPSIDGVGFVVFWSF